MRQSFHLLIVLAFLTSVLAPACGFSWGGKYSVVEICTAQGIESKIVKSDENPNTPMPESMSEKCPFCIQQMDLKAIAVTSEKIRSDFYSHTYKIAALNTQLLRETLYTPHSARAPPALV